jgi:hypothetical protein
MYTKHHHKLYHARNAWDRTLVSLDTNENNGYAQRAWECISEEHGYKSEIEPTRTPESEDTKKRGTGT